VFVLSPECKSDLCRDRLCSAAQKKEAVVPVQNGSELNSAVTFFVCLVIAFLKCAKMSSARLLMLLALVALASVSAVPRRSSHAASGNDLDDSGGGHDLIPIPDHYLVDDDDGANDDDDDLEDYEDDEEVDLKDGKEGSLDRYA
jgi:hypothetical protein